MRMIWIILLSILTTVLFTSCNQNENPETGRNKLKSFEWLQGVWENNTEEGSYTESWTRENDSTYSGTSYYVEKSDTINAESIRLIKRGDDIFYIPVVRNQNQGKPVEFKLTQLSDSSFVFENPLHDFPEKIAYTKYSGDSLVAVISGKINGNENSQSFPMKRLK